MLAWLELQGLKGRKRLKHRALSIYMGNGMRATVEAIGSFDLILPSGLINSCISRKMARKPFLHQVERAKDLLVLIHTDVCGSFKTVSREGASYFITFTDDFSRYGYVYLMKHKHEVFETFKVFQNKVENQLGKKIKAIRSDRGGKYMSHEFVNHVKSCGIVSQLTPPYTPQHNGVSERRNQTLLDMVRSMMNYQLCQNPFGDMLSKASGSHGVLESSGSDKGLELIQEEDIQPFKNTSEIHNKVEPQNVKVLVRRSARIPQAPDRYGFYVDVEEYKLGDLNEPPNYKAALSNPEFEKWLKAMNTEMQSIKDNQVQVLVDLPPNGRTVGSKWLFKKKTDMNSNVHTFKARLVAKGYTQTYDVYYGETFSLVADIRAIWILLTIAAFYDYEIWQMDVKIAFLNSHLSEDIYMVQPEGFDVKIKKIGFTQNPDEPCVYLKASGSNVAFLILFVDDILLMGNKVTMLQEVKSWLYMMIPNLKRGMCSYLMVLPVDWKSAKQSTTAMSSIKAEYIAAAEASMEAVWMRKFIDGLGNVEPSNKRHMEMLCNNEPAIAITIDPCILKGARNFQRKYHYIHEVIQEREIVLKKVHTYDNVADPFTNPISFNKHYEHVMAIGIVRIRVICEDMLKGAYFGAKTKTFEDYPILTNTSYPGKEIRRISAKSSQEYAYSQFPIRRIHLLPYTVNMDDPNITMEEYTRLGEEKARRCSKVYNWETATYGKIWCNEDVHDLKSVETEFPAIVFNDALTSEVALSCEPTVVLLTTIKLTLEYHLTNSTMKITR
ncbi:retrotransposon protein, putative, ty1-copia subclass [Tanacetum coccineum]